MKRYLFGLGALVFAALAALACDASVAENSGGTAAPSTTSASDVTVAKVPLESMAAASISGYVTIKRAGEDGAAIVAVDTDGLSPRVEYVVHLHSGTCGQAGSSAGGLGRLVAENGGRAQLQTSTVTASAAGATVGLTVDLLGDGDHLIDVHGPADEPVVCGEIPAIGGR